MNTWRRDSEGNWRSKANSYRTPMHPHHWWLLDVAFKHLERSGALEEMDQDIIDEFIFVLTCCNPKNGKRS
jgi:hypothetical protein